METSGATGANAINAAGLNTTTCAGRPCIQDWTGKQLVRAPDWTANLGADYTLNTSLGTFIFDGHAFYTSSYIPVRGDLDTRGGYRYGQGDYTTLNVRASWSPAEREELKLTVFGTNVTDTR